MHLLQTREDVKGTSETTGSAVWEVVVVEAMREAGDADEVDTTAEVAGEWKMVLKPLKVVLQQVNSTKSASYSSNTPPGRTPPTPH